MPLLLVAVALILPVAQYLRESCAPIHLPKEKKQHIHPPQRLGIPLGVQPKAIVI
jgi:hypothetical protein